MRIAIFPLALLLVVFPLCKAQETAVETASLPHQMIEFHVRYVNGNNVYIDGGRNAGLAEGTNLVLKQSPANSSMTNAAEAIIPGVIAQLKVISVAATSAVCEVTSTSRELVIGDAVSLPQAEIEKIVESHALGNTRPYPMVVSFTEGDPLDEDVREAMPHPPLPEINQARGRIGFDLSTIQGLGQTGTSSTVAGMVFRADISRMWGTHWNLNGYWRGRLQSASTPSQPSLQDLINRTYQMSLTYVNPDSSWTAGVGRLYLPWASSLEAIDGGYLDRQITPTVNLGLFGGSTPDPAAWNYNPMRKIGGLFVNAHGGNYEDVWYTSTTGFGVNLIGWGLDRPFLFTENDVSFKRKLSLYHSMQIDRPTANLSMPSVSVGIGQSLLSLRYQVHSRVSLDLNHTYFRDVPTYDPALVGTGLLDKYLYQGVNAGTRIDFPLHIAGYASLGRSSNSSDTKSSLNSMFGVTMSKIWKTGLQADVRYAKFDSAFASGNYRTLSLSRDLNEKLRMNCQGGQQCFFSSLSKNTGSYFVNCLADANLGSRYFLESGFTTQRGGSQSYNQWTATFGYRFDNRAFERKAAHATRP